MHSSVQWDTMQTRGEVHVTHLHLGNARLHVGGKHENILSDKFSTIENRGLDKLLSRPACLIALFRKRINQLLQLLLLLVLE